MLVHMALKDFRRRSVSRISLLASPVGHWFWCVNLNILAPERLLHPSNLTPKVNYTKPSQRRTTLLPILSHSTLSRHQVGVYSGPRLTQVFRCSNTPVTVGIYLATYPTIWPGSNECWQVYYFNSEECSRKANAIRINTWAPESWTSYTLSTSCNIF